MKYRAGDRTVSLAPRPERAPRLAQPGGAPGGAPGASQVQQLARLAEAGERTRQESGRHFGRKARSANGQGPKHDTGRSSAEILGRENERRRSPATSGSMAQRPAHRARREQRGTPPPQRIKGASLRSRDARNPRHARLRLRVAPGCSARALDAPLPPRRGRPPKHGVFRAFH